MYEVPLKERPKVPQLQFSIIIIITFQDIPKCM